MSAAEWIEVVAVACAGGMLLAIAVIYVLAKLLSAARLVDHGGWVVDRKLAPHPPGREMPTDLIDAPASPTCRQLGPARQQEAVLAATVRGDFAQWASEAPVIPPHEMPPGVPGRTETEEV